MSKLVRDKEFADLEHFKLLFSVGGGSNSTKPGALYTVLKVSSNIRILGKGKGKIS